MNSSENSNWKATVSSRIEKFKQFPFQQPKGSSTKKFLFATESKPISNDPRVSNSTQNSFEERSDEAAEAFSTENEPAEQEYSFFSRVIINHFPTSDVELTVNIEDFVQVLEFIDDYWVWVSFNGAEGYIPKHCLDMPANFTNSSSPRKQSSQETDYEVGDDDDNQSGSLILFVSKTLLLTFSFDITMNEVDTLEKFRFPIIESNPAPKQQTSLNCHVCKNIMLRKLMRSRRWCRLCGHTVCTKCSKGKVKLCVLQRISYT